MSDHQDPNAPDAESAQQPDTAAQRTADAPEEPESAQQPEPDTTEQQTAGAPEESESARQPEPDTAAQQTAGAPEEPESARQPEPDTAAQQTADAPEEPESARQPEPGTIERETTDDGSPANSGTGEPVRRHRREVPAVLVRFRVPGQMAEYDAGKLDLCPRARVVLDSDRGQAVGTVVRGPKFRRPDKPLRRVLRVITDEDERVIERNRVREREAHQFCVERIKARGLPMKLVSVDLAHSGTRAVFYFSSADRVDFRALVKDLARRFHTRIEMRQIGVRDASRHTGGIGICGRELCCAAWLPGFKPISIRMAKDQNLALNHQKLSGLCGRLRCCLQYEQEIYQKQRKGLPKVGKRVITPQGEARVKDVDVLRRRVRVQLAEGGYVQFDADEIQRPGDVQHARPAKEPEPTPENSAAPTTPESQPTTTDEATTKPSRPRRRRRRRGRRGRSRKTDNGRKNGGGGRSKDG